MGNLIADSYRGVMNQVDPTHPTQIALEANGAIRDGIAKGASGIFSFYDLYRPIPLGGSPYDSPQVPGYSLCGFYLAGAEIQGMLNQLLDMNNNTFFVQISGLKYTYDPNGPTGNKVKSITVDSGGGVYVPINPAGLYKLGATYYVGSFMVALGLYPRDSTGLQHKPPTYPDPMKDFRVLTGATTELKAWQALTKAVSSFPDLDSDGLPNVPPPYANLQGRIIRLNSVPTTTSLVPANKTAGDPGFTLTVNGTNFAENSQVMWNGEARATTYLSPTQVSAEITTADLASVGTAAVTVVNPTPGGGTSNAQTFTINAPPAAASTFYFAEGTCRPNFDSYITIQNPGGNDADVTVTYMKGDGTTKFVSLTVPKSSRATVSPRDTLGTGNDAAHDFSAKVECTNGQQITAERPMYFNYNGVWTGGHDVVGATSPASAFYFAEGTCRPNFDPYICVLNPGGSDANVTITYMKGDGTTKSATLTVPKNSRSTVLPRDTLGTGNDAAHDFSAKVECTNGQQIVAERPMYFNYNGIWTGGSDVVGATSPASAFYFAEGTCRPNFDPYVTILNPGANDANVTVTYMKGDGTTATQQVTVPKNARSTVMPRSILGTGNDAAHDFSITVECTNGQKIVAERPMYFNYNGIWTGGHDVVGATAPQTIGWFAEGTCRPNFDPWITIQNPGANDANVTITYMKGDGTTASQQITVPRNARRTIDPRLKLGTGNDAAHDFSVTVECTNGQKIVAERPIYFNYNGVWTGGSCTIGFTP
jgi:translation initiation factor IF-1